MKDKQLLDLGRLSGKVLIFGGVYGNLQALQALKKIAEKQHILPSNIICTGDITGYCAQPEACIQLIREWKINSIIGNVEQQLRNNKASCGCNFKKNSRCDDFSISWYPFTQQNISKLSINQLNKLPNFIKFQYLNHSCLVVHGSYSNISEYIFKSTPWNIKQQNFDKTGVDVIFAGHSGLPFHHIYKQQYWVNAGVIGMPANDGTQRVWCLILGGFHHQLQFHHQPFNYPIKETYQLMVKNQLPNEYAETLITGIWDNCEILPEKETTLQGKAINF